MSLSPIFTSPNGTVQVAQIVSATEFQFLWPFPLTGAPLPGGSATPDEGIDRLPYMPLYGINSWSYVGTAITLNLAFSNFIAPIILSGTTDGITNQVTGLSDTSGLNLNMAVSGPGIAPGSVITNILSMTAVELSQTTTAPGTNPITFSQQIVVSGLQAGSNAPNGMYVVTGLGVGQYQVQITASVAPTGSPTVAGNAAVRPNVYVMQTTVENATPPQFNAINQQAYVLSDTQLSYICGPDSLPVLGVATGPIQIDGVIAVSTVLNPIQVTTIVPQNDGSGDLTVTTVVPHQLTTASNVTFTIYGVPADSIYITEYQNVGIQYVSAYVFKLTGTSFTGLSNPTYTNPGNTQPTYIKFQNNPYPGPLQWSSDIIIKGVIGDKSFTLLQSAVAATTAQDPNVDPLANKFNYNGQTGTVYIQDGEVAFIKLQRNLSMSAGASYSCTNPTTVVAAQLHLLIFTETHLSQVTLLSLPQKMKINGFVSQALLVHQL